MIPTMEEDGNSVTVKSENPDDERAARMAYFRSEMSALKLYLRTGRYRPGASLTARRTLRNRAKSHFVNDNGQLMHRKPDGNNLIVLVSVDEVDKILQIFHTNPDGSHSGINNTIHKITKQYWWTGIRADVYQFVTHRCSQCQVMDKMKTEIPQRNCLSVDETLARVGLDVVANHHSPIPGEVNYSADLEEGGPHSPVFADGSQDSPDSEEASDPPSEEDWIARPTTSTSATAYKKRKLHAEPERVNRADRLKTRLCLEICQLDVQLRKRQLELIDADLELRRLQIKKLKKELRI